MSYQAGDTYPASITIRDANGNPADPDSLVLSVRDPSGEVTPYEYGVDVIVVRDSAGVFHADVALTDPGMWVFAWATMNEAQVEGVQVWVSPSPSAAVTFCTPADIATRLGRDLTEAEQATATMLCELVTDQVAAAVDEDADWAAALDPIPLPLRAIAIDVVHRVMRNPSGYSSTSETLGAYSYTQRYGSDSGDAGAAGGFTLTPAEARRVRRAVFGASVASIEVASIFDQELPLP